MDIAAGPGYRYNMSVLFLKRVKIAVPQHLLFCSILRENNPNEVVVTGYTSQRRKILPDFLNSGGCGGNTNKQPTSQLNNQLQGRDLAGVAGGWFGSISRPGATEFA